jgi:hypothetical protein
MSSAPALAVRSRNENGFKLMSEIEEFLARQSVDSGEIARLNLEIFDLQERNTWLVNENAAQRSLIIELADELSHYALLNDFEKSLLQRAQIAAK